MRIFVLWTWVACVGLLGCNKQSVSASEKASPSAVPAQSASAAEAVPLAKAEAAPVAKPGTAKVAKIVFVGKEHACDCTRKAIDASWTALQSVLGTQALVPVEQLKIDTEGAKVEPYHKQKAIMALPAIYFLDEKGVATEVLQGEVNVDQVKAVFK